VIKDGVITRLRAVEGLHDDDFVELRISIDWDVKCQPTKSFVGPTFALFIKGYGRCIFSMVFALFVVLDASCVLTVLIVVPFKLTSMASQSENFGEHLVQPDDFGDEAHIQVFKDLVLGVVCVQRVVDGPLELGSKSSQIHSLRPLVTPGLAHALILFAIIIEKLQDFHLNVRELSLGDVHEEVAQSPL